MQTTPKFNHAAKIYVIFISVGNPKSESNFLYPKKLWFTVFQSYQTSLLWAASYLSNSDIWLSLLSWWKRYTSEIKGFEKKKRKICIVKVNKGSLQLNMQVFIAVFIKRGRSVPAHETCCSGILWLIRIYTFDWFITWMTSTPVANIPSEHSLQINDV